jgi:23S rRNA (uracil1939-C5)-methyltransferase
LAAPRPASPRSEGAPPPADDLVIGRIGADGDGVAALPSGQPAYLPLTLPGEHVAASGFVRRGEGWAGEAVIVTSSSDRQVAPCPHFGACGGCTLQHWRDAPYAAWKSDQLRAALARAGFADVPLGPLARTMPGARRRVDLALVREGGHVRVGLHRRRDRTVVDIETCLVLEPELVALIGALRRTLPGLAGLRRVGSAVANRLESGIDLLLRTDGPLVAADRVKLTALARDAGLCRVSWALNDGPPEPACLLLPAQTMLAGVPVSPPPGAFLQASAAGESAIAEAVLAGLPDRLPSRARIVELFAGCGTLTFALAERARVVAYEGDKAAHDALRRAVMGRRVEAVQRDLARQPLTVKELTGAAAIVLDPPFTGAAAQMAGIAGSGVPQVTYVSCNPAALARDGRVLREAGYQVLAATPVDQFLWSSQVESVVVLGLARRVRG